MNNLLNYILVAFLVSHIAIAQQLGGTITDADSGMPLPGATVLVKGTTNGTTTDFDGLFQLDNVSSDAILVISYIGYETQEVAVNNNTNFTIALSAVADALEEIVVVGYGTQRKKEVTGAVSVLGAKAIEKLNPVRTEQALQGQIAGVNISSQSGSPGAGLNIRIRGITTNGNNAPLILVDGNRIGDLNALNPNDIQSINVLKDATAGIYGVQASNGVILITTKSGRKDSELDVQVDSYTGFQTTSKKIDLMNAFDFAQYVNDATGKTEFFVYPQTGTDWQDEVFQKAAISEINTTVKGGGDKSAYSIGAGYLTQDGIVGGSNNNYERYNARINYQYDILDNLKLTANALHFYSTKRNLPEGGNGSVLFSAVNLNPNMPVYDENGNFSLADDLSQREIMNPVAQIHNASNINRTSKWTGLAALEYSFWENFTVKSQFNINHATVLEDEFRPELYYGGGKQDNYPSTMTLAGLTDAKIENEVRDFGANYDDWTWDNTITYTNTFNDDHNLTVLLGTSLYRNRGLFFGETASTETGTNRVGQTVWDPGMKRPTINRFDEADLESGADWFDTRLSSIFTRVQYDYKGKYLFSGVFRRDVSSLFSAEDDRNIGYFPSGSIGWNISEEAFLQNVEWISSLKLRMSYGILGNDRIPIFKYITRLDGSSLYASGDSSVIFGKSAGGLGNKDLKWEEQESTNLGLDMRLFDNKLNISVDAYQKVTKDLLLQPEASALPGGAAPGSSQPFVNAGTVRNRGLEFTIGYNNSIGDDFSFNMNYNFSTIDNEVLSLNGRTTPRIAEFGIGLGQIGVTRMEPGLPLGHYFGYKTNGIYQTQAEIDALDAVFAAANPSGDGIYHNDAMPGDFRFVDVNGDGEITEKDRTNIGDPIADFEMGFSFGFNYKNLDFSANAFASIGHEMVRNYEINHKFANKGTYMLRRWQGSGTSNAMPRAAVSSINSNYFNDFHVEDASYVRLQNVQIGYNLTELLGDNASVDSFRIYLSGNNLFTITDYKGYDPSANTGAPLGGALDKGFYPIASTYLIGINLNF